jgi:hypothetical protein
MSATASVIATRASCRRTVPGGGASDRGARRPRADHRDGSSRTAKASATPVAVLAFSGEQERGREPDLKHPVAGLRRQTDREEQYGSREVAGVPSAPGWPALRSPQSAERATAPGLGWAKESPDRGPDPASRLRQAPGPRSAEGPPDIPDRTADSSWLLVRTVSESCSTSANTSPWGLLSQPVTRYESSMAMRMPEPGYLVLLSLADQPVPGNPIPVPGDRIVGAVLEMSDCGAGSCMTRLLSVSTPSATWPPGRSA